MPRPFALLSALTVAALTATLLSACVPSTPPTAAEVHVPSDAATIEAAMQLVSPGGLIVVAAGTYDEQVLVNKPDVTIRGEDRNATVVDGGGVRPYGIVVMADGVRIENLTVAGATFYGVLVTGLHDATGPADPGVDGYTAWDPDKFPPLQRFLVDHVTATNNGLYGIYAFNSQHGVIRDSYASGSSDSGFYVGQCQECDILVTGNVAERNAVGFENANASDSVVIVGNRFSGNRVGMTLLSSYQEAFTPQHANTIVGNVISDNAEAGSPSQAEGGWDTGVGISGGQSNLLERNRITGNGRAGILLTNTEDIAATGNSFLDNLIDGEVRFANVSAERTPASDNCWPDAEATAPAELAAELVLACGSPAGDGQSATAALDDSAAPPGVSFRSVAAPRDQPQLPATKPSRLPGAISMPDLSTFDLPADTFLAESTGTR